MGGFHKWVDPEGLVYKGKSQSKMDHLGVPLLDYHSSSLSDGYNWRYTAGWRVDPDPARARKEAVPQHPRGCPQAASCSHRASLFRWCPANQHRYFPADLHRPRQIGVGRLVSIKWVIFRVYVNLPEGTVSRNLPQEWGGNGPTISFIVWISLHPFYGQRHSLLSRRHLLPCRVGLISYT